MFMGFSVLYLLESFILAIYLIGMEVPGHKLQEKENKVYQELLIYFSRVKHRYAAYRHHVANAVLDAAEGMSYEIQCLAHEMYSVLMESEKKERVREYVRCRPTNRFLKLFMIQAYETSEKGNMFFSENIEYLRLELMEELYRRKKRAHEFAGYVFVAVAPFFMMPLLKQWGVEFAPELEVFYAGTGILLETITFFITLAVYGMILRAKEITMFTEKADETVWNTENLYRNRWVSNIIDYMEKAKGEISNSIRKLLLMSGEKTSYGKFCFRIWITALCTYLMMAVFFSYAHSRERQMIITNVENIEAIAPVASEEKKTILADYILAVTNQCKNKQGVTEEKIRELLRGNIRFGNEAMEQAVVQEIKNKLVQYEQAKGSLGEFLLCLLGGCCAGVLPLLKLIFQTKTIRTIAVHEVRLFQSVVLMERNLPGITVVNLLEDMEVFSQCFKGILQRCINSYGAGQQNALQRLKREGCHLHEGFEELADAFLSVDEIGIELAFAEVENNRRLLEKMTQLENEINLERKKDSADLLAKVPMVLAVGVYFIFPFFVYSLKGAYEVFELLEMMQI